MHPDLGLGFFVGAYHVAFLFCELLLLSTAKIRTTITCWLTGSMLFVKVLCIRIVGSRVFCWGLSCCLVVLGAVATKYCECQNDNNMLAHWLDVVWGY